ncbi:MAG: PTS fructose transporter subunit IIC [Microbacteriaceae bacterium]
MSSSTMGTGTRIRLWLMTGVSYMIPFVAAGGLLIALGFMFGGYEVYAAYDVNGTEGVTQLAGSFNLADPQWWGAIMFWTGKAAFAFLVPVLSGFIAYAIADRPGIAPGFVGGAIAGTVGAGFLGGLVAAFIAGGLALWMSRWKTPGWLKPMMPVVIIPLLSSFVVGFAMFIILGAPLKALMDGLTAWLEGLSGGSMALLGIVLGLMMAFDMGGPVNKVAYVFATTGLASVAAETQHAPQLVVMAIVMAAGMTPPLGLALATVIAKSKFSYNERQNGKAAWIMGASFITEGAIPFAAGDPLRVIPSIMVGSAVTGALVGMFGNELRAPHGGIWVVGLISNPLTYLLAVLVGTVVTAFLVIIAKGIGKSETSMTDEELEEQVA